MHTNDSSRNPALARYWPSPWPGEDGGPRRAQAPHGKPGLRIGDGERIEVISCDAYAVTMVVLRDPGEEVLLVSGQSGNGRPAWSGP